MTNDTKAGAKTTVKTAPTAGTGAVLTTKPKRRKRVFTEAQQKARDARARAYLKTPVGKKKAFNRRLRYYYDITMDIFEKMCSSQGGGCAICGEMNAPITGQTFRRLCVDHDHNTGKIRELLCDSCNRGLGAFKDSPERLRKALGYLVKWK